MSRWYAAASFPSLPAAGEVYATIERFLTGPERPPDVAGYRFAINEGICVAVIADDSAALTHEQRQRVLGWLNTGHRRPLDSGLLDVLFADWSRKRGSGPPVIEHDRWEFGLYEAQKS